MKLLAACCLFASLNAVDSFSTYEKAKNYHDHSLQQWSVAKTALSRISFEGNESILEIGCRGGRVSANMAGRVPNGSVIGVEMRGEGAIEFALINYNKSLYPNLSFLAENFLNSDFREHFDLIVSFSSLHWYNDQKAILERAYQSLKKGGQIFFTIPGKPTLEIQTILSLLMAQDEWKPYFETYVHPRKNFLEDEYNQLLLEAGFGSTNVLMERHTYYFETKRALIDWFKAFSPVLDCVPLEKQDRFLNDFANIYTDVFQQTSDGQLYFAQDELFVQATK